MIVALFLFDFPSVTAHGRTEILTIMLTNFAWEKNKILCHAWHRTDYGYVRAIFSMTITFVIGNQIVKI